MPTSCNTLPGIKPFRAAVADITQVILLDAKDKKSFDLTCICSYIDGDHEIFKESAVLKNISCNF